MKRRNAAETAGEKRTTLDRVGRYLQSCEAEFDVQQNALRAQRKQFAASAAERIAAGNQAIQFDEAAEFSEQAKRAAVQASRARHELEAIRYGSAVAVAPPSVSIETLKDRYVRLVAEYENKVGAQDLRKRVRAIFEGGRRIPEEVLGPNELTRAFSRIEY